MENYPFISIIIPVKNEERFMEYCLQSIKAQNYPEDRYEIIISDGLSDDSTPAIAENMGAIVITNHKQTVSPGRNIGFEYARGDIIAFTDADCVMDRDWLRNCVKYFNRDDKVACVGGPNITPDSESSFGKAVGFVFGQGIFAAGSIHARELVYEKEVSSIPGCNAIYRRTVLEKVMPIDETLLTCDDTQLNRKIIDMGYRLLYTPDVIVYHFRRPTPKKLWKQMYRYAIGRLQVGKRDRRMINIVHIGVGLSLPVIFMLLSVIYMSDPFYLVIIGGTALIFMLFFSVLGILKWRSITVGFNIPFVILIIMTSWSCGFIRELLFPMKRVEGR
ncbi:MAG: glycosyltransferase [Nitrospirota bacterium]